PEPEPSAARPTVEGMSGPETVLVVDDEPLVRRVVAAALEGEGFAGLAADGAEAALDIARRHPGPIHLVLTDVCMPRMRGNELVPLLMARPPRTRALYTF